MTGAFLGSAQIGAWFVMNSPGSPQCQRRDGPALQQYVALPVGRSAGNWSFLGGGRAVGRSASFTEVAGPWVFSGKCLWHLRGEQARAEPACSQTLSVVDETLSRLTDSQFPPAP